MWEYAIRRGGHSHDGLSDEEMLAVMGENGWELVTVLGNSAPIHKPGWPEFYFKRRKATEVTTK